jgi:two-component system OmpR family response regulator
VSASKPVILLVEDEADVRQLMVRMLEGVAILEQADNGASGLQAARRLDGSLSLIVTDIDMPVMDGLEFARIIRGTDRKVPILFITGSDPALAAQAGLNGEVLRKPFGVDDFLDRVMRMVLARQAGPTGLQPGPPQQLGVERHNDRAQRHEDGTQGR